MYHGDKAVNQQMVADEKEISNDPGRVASIVLVTLFLGTLITTIASVLTG